MYLYILGGSSSKHLEKHLGSPAMPSLSCCSLRTNEIIPNSFMYYVYYEATGNSKANVSDLLITYRLHGKDTWNIKTGNLQGN